MLDLHSKIIASGIVQGVGFRPFVYRKALEYGLVGFVRNRGDAVVEIVVEGEAKRIEKFANAVKKKHPPLAQIYDFSIDHSESEKGFKEFKIYKSFERKKFHGSIIPPDVSICNECLRELRDLGNPRHNYFFITCTDCGPRYTIIEKLPYDRPNTTMAEYALCSSCRDEYHRPKNRRFHAQTVACAICGPEAFLTTNKGDTLKIENSIVETGKLMEEGNTIAIKGNGGFHIATSTLDSSPIAKLRGVKYRAQKPFAIMAKGLKEVKTFAKAGEKEAELLTSPIHPIILLEKSEEYYLSDQISPGLHNIGVMLPYTGLHHMLFDQVDEPAFVMTSANPPSEPIIVENEEAFKRLGSIVDYFLLHNRKIAQRCDDSVVKFIGKNPYIIRRSRGYVPVPIQLKSKIKKRILGVGAEENVTGCILLDDKAFLTQYIGDVENLETLNYLENAINHFTNLMKAGFDYIAHDYHPKFSTTKFALDLAEKSSCEVMPIQHHFAHLASLLADNEFRNAIGIVCDGFGYGLDGKAWGGEVLWWDDEGFQRLGHLQEQPMPGGDKATRYPLRMVAGILRRDNDFKDWLYDKAKYFPYGKEEIEILFNHLGRGNLTYTTSCGRILDAVSSLLGVCYERTYEGEPAIKLEACALNGKDRLNLKPRIEGNTIDTTFLISEIFTNIDNYPKQDLAFSAQKYLADGLSLLAIEKANELGVKNIGFTGGVAYNKQMTQTIDRLIRKNGLTPITHKQAPCGDGGISFGQVIATGLTLKVFI